MIANACNKRFVCPEDDEKCRCTRREGHDGSCAQVRRKACERAGLEGVVFHDLRHTWASWMAQRGVPMEVVQKLGGWSTREAMEIYAHHSPASLAEWVD